MQEHRERETTFSREEEKKRRVKSIVYYKSRGTRSIIRRKNFSRECSELCSKAVNFANVIVKCIKKRVISVKSTTFNLRRLLIPQFNLKEEARLLKSKKKKKTRRSSACRKL